MNFKKENNIVLAIGKTEGHLEQSVFAKEILDEKKGPPPEINLFNEKNIGHTLLLLMKDKLIEITDKVLEGIPKQVQLKLPKLTKEPKKLNLPKLKKG